MAELAVAHAKPPRGRRKRRRLEVRLKVGTVVDKFTKYRLDVSGGEPVYLFVLRHDERIRLTQSELERTCAKIEKMIAPSRAMFIATEPGVSLEAFEIVDPQA